MTMQNDEDQKGETRADGNGYVKDAKGRFAPGTKGGPGRPRRDQYATSTGDQTPHDVIRENIDGLDTPGRAWAALEALHALARSISDEQTSTVVAIYERTTPDFDGQNKSTLATTIDAAITAIADRWQLWPELP